MELQCGQANRKAVRAFRKVYKCVLKFAKSYIRLIERQSKHSGINADTGSFDLTEKLSGYVNCLTGLTVFCHLLS